MPREPCEILLANGGPLAASEEFRYGLRQLCARLPQAHLWRAAESAPAELPLPADWLRTSNAGRVLAFIEPALVIAANLATELAAALDDGADCALPDDARSADAPPTDYTTLASLDAYAARLTGRPRFAPWDGRRPLCYMIARRAIEAAVATNEAIDWERLPARCRDIRLAKHAWVHDWSSYQRMQRAEMLALLPAEVNSLLDVGGGEGGFVETFLAARKGVADLLEPSEAALVAAARGLTVLRLRLGQGELPRRYGAVSMLDVLEHLEDPLAGLLAARQALEEGGYLLLSVPNIGHWRIVSELLAGRFDYAPVGILCITHLRFFTAASLRALLDEAGFRVELWRNVGLPLQPAMREMLSAVRTTGLTADEESLGTEAFHVLARRN